MLSEYRLQVTLVRHGQPTVSLTEWIQGRSLRAFVNCYNQAGISPQSKPPEASLNAIQGGKCVWTSDFVRTIESAKLLGLTITQSDQQFQEVDCWFDFPVSLPLPAWCWILLTRVLWPLNLIQAPEDYTQAQARAKQSAITLINFAKTHKHIVLVGHSGMNTLIARELRAMGWQGAKQPKLSHWGATTYLNQEAESCPVE